MLMVCGYQSDLAQRILNGGFVLPHDRSCRQLRMTNAGIDDIFHARQLSSLYWLAGAQIAAAKGLSVRNFPVLEMSKQVLN